MKNIILDMKKQGKTIFITTHNMHDADELCDRVAFIVDGEIKAMDAPKHLKRQGGERKVRVEYQNGGLQTGEFPLDGLGENETFLSILKAGQLESIHSEEASLEDVFIKVTGRTLA
jgi:fluoroquinolone transport system ATP-binding protein